MARLDDLLLHDEPDPQWTPLMVAKIDVFLGRRGSSGKSLLSINSLECKSVMCRLVVTTGSHEKSQELEDALMLYLADDIPDMLTIRGNAANGNVVSTFYLIRDGGTLEQMLDSPKDAPSNSLPFP